MNFRLLVPVWSFRFTDKVGEVHEGEEGLGPPARVRVRKSYECSRRGGIFEHRGSVIDYSSGSLNMEDFSMECQPAGVWPAPLCEGNAMRARVSQMGLFGGYLDRRHVRGRRSAREPAADVLTRAANPEHAYLEARTTLRAQFSARES